MSFLLPMFWSAMALGGAIVVFYLIREKPRQRLLSSLLFWERLHTRVYEAPLWRKLRRWVSLLLQILFLALLVFALARPVADWEMAGVRSRVLVLDPSASMSTTDVAGGRFQQAKDQLRAQIQRMRFFDEAALLLASDPPQILCGWTRSRRSLLVALDQAKPAAVDSDVRPALEVARNLAATRENAEVDFFTDGVASRQPEKELIDGVIERRVAAGSPRNAGLSLFAARRSLVAPGEFSLMARVDVSGDKPMNGEIEILRDDALIDAQLIEIVPGKPWQRSWNLRAEKGGVFTARLKGIEGDQLAADDQASVTIEPLKPIPVTLVSPPDNFLEAVFRSMPGVEVKRVWPADKAGAGDANRLWVFNRVTPPPEFLFGAMVLVAPEKSGRWGELKGNLADPVISDTDRDSPVLRFVSLENVRVARAQDFVPAQGAHVLASSFGHPLIFGKWGRDSRWLVVGFNLEQSDFVLRTAFPILMENLVQSLREGSSEAIAAALPGSSETRLAARKQGANPPEARVEWTAPWTMRPMWWWALMFGALWLLAEWWTYHRRITE
jgi:hypothetical protein